MIPWLILHTAVAVALAGLVLVVSRWRRLGPAARHALWLVVLLKLLTPPFVYWPWSLPAWSFVRPEETGCLESEAERASVGLEAGDHGAAVVVSKFGDRLLSLVEPSEPAEKQDLVGPSSGSGGEAPILPGSERVAWVLGLVWLGGGLIVATTHLKRMISLRRCLTEARPAPAWLENLVRELAGVLGVRPPRCQVLPGIGSPVVWGLGRARLLWPAGLEQHLSPQGCRAVLVHELAHLRRRDHWVGWLMLLGGCVWWWHPLFRFVRWQLGREAELACDAWVVGLLPEARRAYAEALIEVCEQSSVRAAPVPALGAAGRRRDLERRLIMIMRERVPFRLSLRVIQGVCVLALLAVPAWSLGQVAEKPKTPKPVEQEAPEGMSQTELALMSFLQAAQRPQNAASERDKKLQELEAKVQALLKELQALRASGNPTASALKSTTQEEASAALLQYRAALTEHAKVANYAQRALQAGVKGETALVPGEEVTLIRTTYKLPAGKAEALAAFLKEHLKAPVLETKVQGDNLTVTTTPDFQRGIAQFVHLLEGKPPRAQLGGMKSSYYEPAKK